MSQPYHESIVLALDLTVLNSSSLFVLGLLIENTKLPHNHDAVFAAWMATCQKIHGERFGKFAGEEHYQRVVSHIAAEKERVAKEAEEAAAAIQAKKTAKKPAVEK